MTSTNTYTSEDLAATVAGQTVASAFAQTVRDHGARTALRWQAADGSWGEWTFADYADRAARVATGLAGLGVRPGDRVVLMMRNIPEFHVVDMAVTLCGATPVSIYNSSSPEQVAYLVGHCGAKLGVVEDAGFLDRFAEARSDLPDLGHLVSIRPDSGADSTLEELLAHDPVDLDQACGCCTPETIATIIYTSGTTGPPKGVVLDHANVLWTVESLRLAIGLSREELVGKRLVSYLPMAHIAERATSHYQQAIAAYEVTCCPDPGQIAAYAREVRPNIMFGVPRVWEKIHAGVVAALAANPEQARQFDEAVAAARPLAEKLTWDEATEEERQTWEFLDSVAFSGVRELLGLDQLDLAITGAAPIPADLLSWYRAIGVPLSEIYGMSESSGPMTWAAHQVKPGTVGPAIPGCDVRLAEDGEVICRGGNVFQGYLNDPQKTAEALDEDGWLHSGDIGQMDEDGYLRIVDRKKELIITAGGKNVSPANLEGALKSITLVGQAAAIGDQRPFISALVVLDPDTAPIWAEQQGITFSSLEELAEHPDVIAEVERQLVEVMEPFNSAEKVKKVKVLGSEWLPDSDELTPTSKLKRRGIHAKYAREIEDLYS